MPPDCVCLWYIHSFIQDVLVCVYSCPLSYFAVGSVVLVDCSLLVASNEIYIPVLIVHGVVVVCCLLLLDAELLMPIKKSIHVCFAETVEDCCHALVHVCTLPRLC